MRTFTRCRDIVQVWRTRYASYMKVLLTILVLGSFLNQSSAQSVGADFKQASNDNSPTPYGSLYWINSILQQNNSQYAEGMSTLQRLIFTGIPATPDNVHTFRVKLESDKNGYHAYDFISGWELPLKAAAEIIPGSMPDNYSDPTLNICGDAIAATAGTACDQMHESGFNEYLPISGETDLVLPGDLAHPTTTEVIANYEAHFGGTRRVRIWGNSAFIADALNNRVTFVGYDGAGHIVYDITWKSASTNIDIEFAAHIAAGLDPIGANIGYGLGRGAADINGGPYHVTTDNFMTGEANIGSMDNQLKGADIVLKPMCNVSGPLTTCAGTTGLLYHGNVTNLNNPTYNWSFTSNTSPTAAVFTSAINDSTATVTAGSAGTYTIRLIVTNDNGTGLADTCYITTTVNPPPTVTCPTNTTVASCQTQGAVDTAYATWLATASSTGGTLTNNSTGAPNHCGGTKTVTFTVTGTCGSTTCTSSFTVTNAPAVTLTCPANTTVASCQTQAAVDAAYATWLASVTKSGGCNAVLTNNSTGAPSHCGGSKLVTFTVTSDCQTNVTCQASFTVSTEPAPVITCPTNLTVASCQTQAAVDAAYATWLATASFTGCHATMTNNSTGAPNHCGGTKTVTFTVTSDCNPNVTCSASFTVTAAPPVVLTCPTNTTVAAGQTQAAVDAAYATWLASVSASGGCNRVLTNNSTGAPDHCGGTKTVTFTVASDCQANVTCSASFTVTGSSPIVLTCPANTTVTSCQTQAAVDASYATWLGSVVYSGGTLTTNSTGAPSHCGGTKTVTFTVTGTCGTQTCSASYTVTAAPPVVLTCPTNTTVASCQTQAAVDAAYATWLASVTKSGGCNAVLTNNSTGAPSHCGGTKTVTFTVASDCQANVTCSASFTVTTEPAPVITCPTNLTVASCQSQSAVNTAYANWLATASFTGCHGTLSNNSTGAPDHCGGTKTVLFTVTSDCNSPVTCTASFTVTSAPAVVLSCPRSITVASCQSQTDINAIYANWLTQVSTSGGCNSVLTNNSTGAPNHCGGTKTVTYTVTSDCQTVTCASSFTVAAAPPVVLTCPTNTTIAGGQTQDAVDAAYATWLASVTLSGGCNAVLTNNSTGAPDRCGGTKTVTFTVTSDCETTRTCTASFTVSLGCLDVLCTYTQGYFGNPGGMACDGSPSPNMFNTFTTIYNSIHNYWSDNLVIGGAQRSVLATSSTTDINSIIDVLPGGGAARAFDNTGQYSISNLPASYLSKQHRINNQLFSQTLTLGINMGIKPGLGSFALQANKWLVTADVVECGSTDIKTCQYSCVSNGDGTYTYTLQYTPYHVSGSISQAIYNALSTKNVAGLYALANSALNGDALPAGVSYSDISGAVDLINNAFDGCRSFITWSSGATAPSAGSFCTPPSPTTPCPPSTTAAIARQAVTETAVNGMKVTAYPNPYGDVVKFTIMSKVSGQAQLEVYNMLGQKVNTVYNGFVQANRSQVIDYKVPVEAQQNLIYILKLGGQRLTGKLLKAE